MIDFFMTYFNEITIILVAVLIILIVIFIIAFVYKRLKLRKLSLSGRHQDEHFDSLVLLSSGVSNENLDSSEIPMECCTDIMECKCIFNLSAVFNSNEKMIRNVSLFWKEGEIITETFNCEIRKVDLLIANKSRCIQHSGGIVKKLKNKNAWSNELSIYQLSGLRHPNILVFLDAYHHRAGPFKYSLITAEAKLGSLYSYLMNNPWNSINQCVSVIIGIVNGVTHLHACSISLKPPIVHRDLKSKNILLKCDLTPCIADFGLASILKSNSKNSKEFVYNAGRVGTQRYMAPEILEGIIGNNAISYLSSDVYAMGLVLWEVLSQCPKFDVVDGSHVTDASYSIPQYCLPFTFELKSEVATLEKMIDLVCVNGLRPRPHAWWILNDTMRLIWTTINDCWEQVSEERISASLVNERFKVLAVDKT